MSSDPGQLRLRRPRRKWRESPPSRCCRSTQHSLTRPRYTRPSRRIGGGCLEAISASRESEKCGPLSWAPKKGPRMSVRLPQWGFVECHSVAGKSVSSASDLRVRQEIPRSVVSRSLRQRAILGISASAEALWAHSKLFDSSIGATILGISCRICESLNRAPTECPTQNEPGEEGESFLKRCPEPFINLSSTGAFVRHAFALNAALANMRINKIGGYCMPTNQKVGCSNHPGRTIKIIDSLTS